MEGSKLARYAEAVCRLCRREGMKLLLKGERCFTPKCAFEKRAYAPGQHGKTSQFRRKESDYSMQLREKQRARRIYGIFEKQFRRYFREAQRQRGLTGTNLLVLLESRLDNAAFRLGFGTSRAQTRQLIQHGHFAVNGVKTDVPSYLMKPGDVISVRDNSKNRQYFKDLAQTLDSARVPGWLSLEAAAMTGKVVKAPSRSDVEITLSEQLIVEYYSR
jgi:small subunit ribosomal protein S4